MGWSKKGVKYLSSNMKMSYQLLWDFHQEQESLQEDAWNSSLGQLFETNIGKKRWNMK